MHRPVAFRPRLLLLILLLWAPLGAQESVKLLEGFEEGLWSAAPQKVRLDSFANGVTQGQKAAEIKGDAVVEVAASGQDVAASHWLKVDTYNPQEEPVGVKWSLRAGGASTAVEAFVGPGSDVLALPLDWIRKRLGRPWPESQIQWSLGVVGPERLIIDSIRLETVSGIDGTMAWDFGPEDQALWPGFAGRRVQEPNPSWSGKYQVREYDFDYPDPLTADCGGYAYPDMTDTLELSNPDRSSRTAWLWVTHWGYAYGGPSPEWWVRDSDSLLAGEQLSVSQRFGPRGLTRGLDAPWTPQWFSREYPEVFCALVKTSIPPGGRRLELRNAQVAAMVSAPAGKQIQAQTMVSRIREDLTRFRRQFILGRRKQTLCRVEPTEDEKRNGLMVFAVDDLDPENLEAPTRAQRADALRGKALAGTRAFLHFAVVGLRDQLRLQGRVQAFRGRRGGLLRTEKNGLSVKFFQRVADLRPPEVTFVPWVLRPAGDRTPASTPVYGLVEVAIDPRTPAGVYRGELLLTGTAGRTRVPLELEVKNFALLPVPQPAAIAYRSYISAYQPSIFRGLESTTQARLHKTLHDAWLEAGGTSLALRGAHQREKMEDWVRREYEAGHLAGLKEFEPPILIRMGYAEYYLRIESVQVGTSRYQEEMALAAGRTKDMARALRLDEPYLTLEAWEREELASAGTAGKYLTQAGARAGLHARLSELSRVEEKKDFEEILAPYSLVCIRPNGPNLRQVCRGFLSLPGLDDRKVLLYSHRVSRLGQGFYAAGAGASGSEFTDVLGDVSVYRGFDRSWTGLLVWQSDGSLAETLPMLRIREGMADWSLLTQCRTLVETGKQAGINVGLLEGLVAEAESLGDLEASSRGSHGLEFRGVGSDRLAELRSNLLEAGQGVAGQLRGK